MTDKECVASFLLNFYRAQVIFFGYKVIFRKTVH